MPVSGPLCTALATAAFLSAERSKTWFLLPLEKVGVVRGILAGALCGSLIGADFAEILRRDHGYWSWESGWYGFVIWVALQLVVAALTYGMGRASSTLYQRIRGEVP